MLPAAFLPSKPSDAELARATKLVQALETACDGGVANPPALSQLRAMTSNEDIKVSDYHEISGAMSYEASALLAFYPAPRQIPNLTFDQFGELCKIMKSKLVEDDFDYWFKLFCINAKNQNAGDLMFDPPQEWINRLIQSGEIAAETTVSTFSPSVEQLAKEGWRDTRVAL